MRIRTYILIILLFVLVLGCSDSSSEPDTVFYTLFIDVDISNGVTVSFDSGQSVKVSAWKEGLINLESGVYNYSVERSSFLLNDIILSGSLNMNSNKTMRITKNPSDEYIIDWSAG